MVRSVGRRPRAWSVHSDDGPDVSGRCGTQGLPDGRGRMGQPSVACHTVRPCGATECLTASRPARYYKGERLLDGNTAFAKHRFTTCVLRCVHTSYHALITLLRVCSMFVEEFFLEKRFSIFSFKRSGITGRRLTTEWPLQSDNS